MKHRRVQLSKKPSKLEDLLQVELDLKCSCSPSTSIIQFSRRYLQCPSSMPIRILRSYIEQVLPHSPLTEVSIYDSNNRLLNDADRLKEISSSLSSLISLRFTMINTITSLGHCVCVSPSSSSVEKSRLSSSPVLIRRETINRTLSTCSLIPTPPHSPALSLSPIPTEHPMPIVNLLTPPSPVSYSSFLIDNLVESTTDQSIIDQITSEFGEICPLVKPKRTRLVKKLMPKAVESPLDLTLKKRPPSFDLFSTQSKWLKMI